jgi:hypothetical protein
MATIKRIENLHYDKRNDPELFQKLNAVAPVVYRKPHDFVRMILLQELDKIIEQHGINVYQDQAQPAVG